MMINKILTISALTAILLFSGCDNDAEDRMSTQLMLDSGDFDGVIESLENKEDRTADDNLKLASAYMDKAGFSSTDLISIISNTDTNNSFASFIVDVSENKTSETLDDLQKAIEYYTLVISGDSSIRSREYTEENTDLGSTELFLGLAYIAKVATVLSYMGDVTKLEDVGIDGDLAASGCAMMKVYASNENVEGCASTSYTGTISINDYQYEKLDVVLDNGDGNTYHYLATNNKEHLVLTDYKTDCNNTGYPCPVDDENLTVMGALLDTLNSSFDFIINAAPEDVKGDIEDYRDEINLDNDPKISVTEFVNYINTEMVKN